MVPPKKDAFADIFQSATSSSSNSSVDRNKNLAHLQQQRINNNSSLSGLSQPLAGLSSGSSTWNEFDIFTSPSPSSSTKTDGIHQDDPFDIFNSNPQPDPKPSNVSGPIPQPAQKQHQLDSQKKNNSSSLLDDEFTDAFQEHHESHEQEQQIQEQQIKEPRQSYKEPEPFEPESFEPRSESTSAGSARDEIVAQLLDIGFPPEVSNKAIDHVGLDLQACVNFIMSGGKLGSSKSGSSRTSNSQTPRTQSPQVDDIGAKLNDLSTDFFNKASVFFNKSRDTVIKNFEQFQQTQSGRNSPNNSVPAWMVNQSEYKKNASEKKANGEKYEDYGSDEDNIDQDAIREFMMRQKQKDREKTRAKFNGSRSTSPTKSPVPQVQKASQQKQEQPVRQQKSKQPGTQQKPEPEADLLGLGGTSMSRAQKFRSGNSEEDVYVSSRRRRAAKPSAPNVPRRTTREPLNQFLQSDYDIGKEKAGSSFTNGNYDDAYINYTKCLNALPETHELRIIINSNLAITLNKLGNYKQARDHCDQGLALIDPKEVSDVDYIINGKPVKFWYTKLLSRKAEALEMIESFEESLACYMELVTKLGVNDKKTMDAKRRVHSIVNPPPKPKSKSKPTATKPVQASKPLNNDNLKRVQESNKKQQDKDNLKYQLHDKVQARVTSWSNGKEDNLRSLLMSLPDVLPAHLGFPFLTTKKITINDLMLPKKVKINYMKVISSIHPDKLNSLNLQVEDEMLCQAVFITLNKSWDMFKEQNGIN